MTKPSPMGDNMRVMLRHLADENELTIDELFEVFQLVSAGEKDKAISLLIGMMGRKRNLDKFLERLKAFDLTAAKALLKQGKD